MGLFLGIRPGVTNYTLWAKFALLPVFVNKALLEIAMPIHLHIISDYFLLKEQS